MAISMLDNISYKGKKSDNVRSEFPTISEMVAYSENYLPDIYETFCLEDGNKYVFKRSNEVDPTLGKWRLASSGSYELPTASSSTKGGVKIGAGLTMTGEVLSADEEPISEETDNILERKDDGLYVPETDLSNYVEKETGKGLSTNDLTDELKAQYDAAEENVQSDWSEIDATKDAFILNKPTKLSDFTNDSGFITKLVEDLENYYTKTQTYTKTEVNALVNAINQFNVIKVTELPTTDIDTHAIYFLSKTGTTGDVFDEYMYIDEEWELIGTTQIDLSEYAKKVELSQIETLPAATSDNEGRIYQYVGATTANYTNGFFYKCTNTEGVYSWKVVNVQAGGGGGGSLSADITPNITVGGLKSGETLSAGTTFDELFQKMLIEYQKPTITLSITPSTTLYEKGTTISTLTLSANATKKSEDIANIKFYQGSTLLETITDGVAGGGNFTCGTAITAFDTDTIFKASVTDSTTGSTVDSSKTVKFVVPFYYGNSDTSTVSALTGLTKDLSEKGTKTYSYTSSNKYLCILYPSSYGNLTSIKDSNNFENIGEFTSSAVTIDSEEYKLYISNEPKTVSAFALTFKF